MKQIVYIDMDGVIADFDRSIRELGLSEYDSADIIPGLFASLHPIEGAIESVNQLLADPKFEVYFLSAAPWDNPEAWMHKRLWISNHFNSKKVRKRLILSHQKQLMIGDYLIDDRAKNGASEFLGQWIHFGSTSFPDWGSVMTYLKQS
ncbi:MAG: hypothetical protein NXH90_01875 [Flavobacteriaceae bacterium]|nr:hypothetical protein [Flavobacteriaceae bacterium]